MKIMDAIDELGPELALAFSCVAAVGSSMIRRFRTEDAKSCTRVCRRILLCAGSPPPSDANNRPCSLTCLDAISAATALLTRRLYALDDIDTTYLSTAQSVKTSLRPETPGALRVLSN
jgi:hypothetical protein